MNEPIVITKNNFQLAWFDALEILRNNHWEIFNLIVQIRNIDSFDDEIHENYKSFCDYIGIKKPKDVAYTIFPHKLYRKFHSSDTLFSVYKEKYIHRLKNREGFRWGTYFQRMIDFHGNGQVNQLQNIINAINSRDRNSKAAYTIIIHKPGGETVKPLGGPCLNSIAVQIKSTGTVREVSLLAVYRNHDFLVRAYGNYWGLINLLKFISEETNSVPGVLTCISSHAYVDKKKTELREFMRDII